MVRPRDGRERIFQKAAFVQRVGVQLDLEIELVGDRQAACRSRRASTPQSSWIFRPMHAAFDLIEQRAAREVLPRPRKPKLIGQCSAA